MGKRETAKKIKAIEDQVFKWLEALAVDQTFKSCFPNTWAVISDPLNDLPSPDIETSFNDKTAVYAHLDFYRKYQNLLGREMRDERGDKKGLPNLISEAITLLEVLQT
jgi:hypothetical protein